MQRSKKPKLNIPNLTPVFLHANHWLKTHPRSVRHAQKLVIIGLIAFTMLNAGLFSVQNGRTAALTTINGKSYGLMPIEDAKQLLQTEHMSALLTVKIGNETLQLNAQKSGVELDSDKTFSPLTDSKGWRHIPLVSAVGNLLAGIKPVYTINEAVLASKLAPHIAEENIPAKDAAVVIPSSQSEAVTIKREESGRTLTAAIAADELAASISANDFTAKITGKTLAAKWTELDIKAFMPAIEAARHTSLSVSSGNQKIELSPEVLAPMLRVDTTGSALKMTLDAGLLKAYLDSRSELFFVAPIATKTTLRDGTEISRTEGKPGKQIDSTATASLAVNAFQNGLQTVEPALAAVTPTVLVTRTYTNTDVGLYKTVEDFANSHAGVYRVAAVELNGPGHRSAFYNADSQVITASTYKLFISYGILQRIEAGSLSMDSATSQGTVESCMYKMIHISDNACASALQTVLGWAAFDKKLAADGFTSTKLNNQTGDKHSTARDEMNLVTRLYNHELLSAASTDYLFGLMENQIYRAGIPAGSRGALVADKVGFLYALNHDIGVVYSPKSSYALVIMTDGAGGWTNVKLLAQQIYDFYNQ